MSKFAIYHVISPLGYSVDIMTDGLPSKVTYEKLFADEEMRIMKIEKTGAKVLKEVANVVPAPQKPLEATTQGMGVAANPCPTCGRATTYREGVSKIGKPYKGYFCSEKGHDVTWVK